MAKFNLNAFYPNLTFHTDSPLPSHTILDITGDVEYVKIFQLHLKYDIMQEIS